MFSALCLTLSAAILYFVLRFRVHIHVTYTPKTETRGPRAPRAPRNHAPRPVSDGHAGEGIRRPDVGRPVRLVEGTRRAEIKSALRNLGCSGTAAAEAADSAMSHQDPDLESALRRAIDYARKAA